MCVSVCVGDRDREREGGRGERETEREVLGRERERVEGPSATCPRATRFGSMHSRASNHAVGGINGSGSLLDDRK